MENNMEKEQFKNAMIIAKHLGADTIASLLEQLKNNESKTTHFAFKEVEFPCEKVVQNVTSDDFNNLKNSEKTIEVNRTFRFHFHETQTKIKGHINVNGEKIEVYFLTPLKEKREFLKKYKKQKSLLCRGIITYNNELDQYFISKLEIFKISESFEKWKKLMAGKSLLEKVEILLGILTLNPKNLYYHEKLMAIMRLIPLVVKKTFMVELSKKMIGKTTCYESLGFNLYNTGISRATAFFDGRDKTYGDFFYEIIAFIIDEFHKVKDEGVINTLQIYMNGDKYIGTIQISRGEKLESSVSPIILANAKVDISTDEIFTNTNGENGKTVSIFENTLFLNSPDGEALISRINLFPNSWGCRNFKSPMKAEKIEYYNIELLKAVIPILRDKELDIAKLYEKMEMTWQSPSIRSAESVEKNFEGLIKLLFPEFLEDINQREIDKHYHELWFLLERAMEMRKTVDNQLKIINSNDNKEQTLPILRSWLKGVMVTATQGNYYIFTPHRIFVKRTDGDLEKVPLDIIGIKMNTIEKDILKNNNFEVKGEDEILVHSLEVKRRNKYDFRGNIFFNHLVGEEENLEISQEDLDFVLEHTFYDLNN